MKILAHVLNLNIHKVIDAAARNTLVLLNFHQDLVLEEHCIPIDPIFMVELAKNKSETKFINLSAK